MAKFDDDQFTIWVVDLDFNKVKLLRQRLSLDVFAPEQLSKIFDDIVMRVDVLYLICSDQAEKAGITDKEFGERVVGTIANATLALLESLKSFFQKTSHGTLAELVAKAIEAVKIVAKANDRLAQNIRKAPFAGEVQRKVAALEAKAANEIAKWTTGETSSDSPESQESETSVT